MLGLAGSRENGSLIGLQNPQPRVDVLGVILTRFRAQAEVSASEGCRQFGYQFLHGIGVIAESLAQFAIASARV